MGCRGDQAQPLMMDQATETIVRLSTGSNSKSCGRCLVPKPLEPGVVRKRRSDSTSSDSEGTDSRQSSSITLSSQTPWTGSLEAPRLCREYECRDSDIEILLG